MTQKESNQPSSEGTTYIPSTPELRAQINAVNNDLVAQGLTPDDPFKPPEKPKRTIWSRKGRKPDNRIREERYPSAQEAIKQELKEYSSYDYEL